MDDDRRREHKGAVKHGTHDDSVNRRSSMFELRLVTLDHYLAAPSAPLDPLVSKLGGWEVWQVPVLRIFGVTPAGQKACLHVHGVLPYLTVPCTEPRPERSAVVLASEIDLLLNTAAGRATSMHRHVHHVAVFRGTRLYGFHDREETFLRIYLYNPLHVPKVAELLLSGHVLKQVMQPHEAHIPYSLQFMVDHNLHGMSFVRVESFKFRRPLSWAHDDRSKALGSGPGIWSLRNLPVEQFGDLEKQTTCELELDCCAKDILNASDKEALNPGLAALWQEEEDRRQEPVSWAPLSLEDVGFPPTESERFYLARLDKLLTRPAMDEQELTGTARQSRKKHHSRLLDTSHGILDSQDEALAEALAQAASSWHQGADEEEDSILGSLPALDNVVDEEDDHDVEDMSQVFQLAGEREQDNDGDSSMSDHSDGNEAYDPFQLDGADDRPVVASGAAAITRDQGTQTGARPPVLVRRLLGRARARRCTRLSLQRRQQQQGNPQLRKPEQSPAKSAVPAAGLETGHQKVEVPGSSPLVAEDWQRWQSCHVASMLMAPLPGDGTPSSGVPSPVQSLSPESRAGGETSSCLQHSVKPCFVELPRLTDEEIASWQQRREPEGRRRWKLRELDIHGKSCASPVEDMSEPQKQRRKRGRSTDSSVAGSTSPQRRTSSLRNRSVSVSSVSPHAEGYTESEVYPVEVGHRTRRVSYSSLAGDSGASSRRVKAGTGKASKRVKAVNDSASGRTLRERDIGEKGDKGQVRVCITDSGDNVESSVLSAAAAAAGLGSELSVPLVERVPHPRRGRKLSTKRRLAVEVTETVPDSDASSSSLSSSSHLVGKSSDLEVSGSRPSIICRIRIQGKHGVVSTTSTRQVPRVVGFVSPDRSITESCVADLGSPPTGSVSDSSSSTIVGRQMSDGPTSGARPLGSEMADPGIASRHKVSKKSKSSNVALDAPAVHLECSNATHMSDAPTSLSTPSSSEVADSGIVLRRPKSSRRSELSTVTPEAPAAQLESSGATHMLDVPEPVATPLSSEVADLGATLRGKFSRNSKSGTATPEAPSAHLEDSEAVTVPDASTSLATSSSSEVADSGVVLRQPRSPRKSKLSTVTREAPAAPLESSEAAHISDAPTPLAMSLSGKVADSGVVSRRLKSSRKSKSSTAAPDPPAVHLESCKAATVPDAPQSDATPSSSEVADNGVVLRAKFSRKSKSSTVIPEAPAARLESSEAVHMPDAAEPVATPLRPEDSDSGVALRLKRSRKSKLSTVTPEAQLESSEAAHMPDTPTSHAMSSEVADSGAVLRPRGSRKSMSNTITPEASETELESPKAMLSEMSPTTVGLSSSDVAPHGLPSRKSTRSGSDAGTKRAKLAASSIASKPTESPEALSSGPARIGTIDNHQLCGSNSRMEMGAPHATLGTLQSGSDVDAIEEPGNVKPVSKRGRPRRTDSVRPLLSSPDSQGAADAASVDSTAHCENTVQPTTRRTRRQLANRKLSSKELSATSSSSLESVTSFSSCEVGGSKLLETSLPKEGNLRKQTAKGKQTSSSKLAIKPSRSKVKDSNALLSLGTENENAAELGTDPVVQVVDQAAKSSKSEARGRVSSRISANKLALRTKIRKEGKNKEKPENPKLQDESCFVADTSSTPPPGSDIGLASTVTVDTMTPCVLSFGTTYSTSPNTAKLVSDCNMTRQVISGSQVTSSGMGDKGISAPNSGAPEIVNSHNRLMSSTSRSSASSDRREVGGLPVRSSKSRKRAGLPEAHDPGIQELLVTYERLTITPPSELSSDGSVGSKQSNVARPSAAFNLSEAAGSSDSPRRSSSSIITNSVEKEGIQKCVGNDEPEAEHPKELSGSSNPIVEKESGSAKSVVSSDRSEAADAGGLMRGADKGAENSPELVPALPVPNCAVTKPGPEDSMIQPSSVSVANTDLVATEELETSSLRTRQCQPEVAAFDVPVSRNLPVSEVITAIEPVVPEEGNGGSAFSSDFAPADTSANVDLHAGSNGPVPGGSVQGNCPIISASTVDVSEPVVKPNVSDKVGTDAPPNKVLLNTLPLGNGSDSSSSSSNNSASVLSRPCMTSPIEQSSSELLDSRHAVQDGSVTELMTELSWSIELGQGVTEGCAEQDANVTGTPELVSSLCGQKGNESQKASSDDVQFEGEPSSRICAGSKPTTTEQPSAVGSINAAEVSSVDDDFICLSPDADAEWILLDEVRDDSIELFPSPEESVSVDCSESCIDHTVENRVSDCGMNCHNMNVSEKNGIGNMGKKELVGHFDSVSTEESVHEDVADENSIQHGSRKSRSERKVESVYRESSIDKSCESSIRNVGSINCADSATGENCVVEISSEGCSDATSSKEHFEISSTDLADTNCEEILRNFGSDSSMVDLGSESFSEPTGGNKCTEEVAKEDIAEISPADLVQGFGSDNCVGDIDSEGMEFIASENFVENIGSEESMELFSGIDSESKQHKDAVALNEISSDSREHEDVYAAIAAGKLLRVAVERLEDIDAHSAIGMLYRKAKKASKYNRAPCKRVEISGDKQDVNRDNSQDEHTGIDEKERSVGLSSVRKSPACHQQTSRPSKSLHKDVGASSSQSSGRRPSDSQAQHQSPREQDRSVRPVSMEKALASDQQTSKSSKTSRKDLWASGNQHSRDQTDESHAQHVKTKKQEGNVVPFSEDKLSSSVKITSKSSKTLHKDSRDTRNQHVEKSAKDSKTQHLVVRKKDRSADPLTADKSSICHQKASKSSKASRKDVQAFKSKDSEGSSNKAETQRPGREKQGEAVEHSSLEKSPSREQQASNSSKGSHRDVQVFKSKDSEGSSNKAETQHPGREKQGEAVEPSSLEKSPSCEQQASNSSKGSHRDVQVFKSKDSEGSSNKAETQRPVREKQREAVEPSSLEKSPGRDQQASSSSKGSHRDVKVFKSKDSEGSSNKAETQFAVSEKQGEPLEPSSSEKSPGRDQQASKSSKASHRDVQVFKRKDSEGSSNKAETRHADKEKQGEAVDTSLERSPDCDQQASKSSKASRRDVQVFKSKDSEGSSNKAETQRADREKQGEAVEPSSLQKSPGHDQQTSKSSRDFHSDLRAFDNQVQVCENRERRPDSPEEQRAGGGTQQQDECNEPLQTEKSLSYHQREPLPPTDMGKEHVLLDQVLDLGELPDAIKCLLDSEVPLPELDADCFSLPPDSTRWLSEDGVVEKRKPDERPQANKEEPPFCPSGDIMLGELTKACSLTNEGLVALVPAVPPPTCGPHFNNCGSTTARARKKCLRGLAHWQKAKLEAFARDSCFEVDFEHNPELRIAFCRDRSVVLTPARSAPTVALLAPTRQRPPPSPDDDVVSIRELPPSDASPDPTMLLVSPPSTPPRHETSTSQLDGPSGRFALSGARLPADTERVLTVLSVEMHVRSRSDLRPDPAHDPVQCVLWCARGHGTDAPLEAGVMHWVLGDPRLADIEDLAGTSLRRTGVATPGLRTQVVRSELDLFHALVDLVHRWDPDVLLGYDVERASWGYLFERAEQLDLDLYARLSRAPPPPGRKDVLGRILLSVWRILRKEVTLNIYTFENTYYNVMHRRVPLYSFRLLSEWFSKDLFRWRTVEHYALRARGNLELLDELNVFGKTSQMARIFGIQFLEVLSRGSQFRVESMLLRLARSHRMVALSASTAQRARQRAPEFIPLVLEPRAQLYTDPVVVLDFQSLYPSVIIAHNYCYSTCLGRVESLGSSAPFGCSSLEVPTQLVKSLRDHITVSPAGVAFVKPSIRRGLLSQMLDEVLGTRIMVKKAMSQCTNKGLRRVLDAQQLSLKLISNVTYGYTSAGFSGRMPCVEVADSVVSKGREALEHAIRTAEAIVPGARVVYGDTDSLFVLLEGRSREEAFRLGQEIADQVTAQNPRPMRLKLEKVYQPCVLQTKKRYVGFAYESPDQQEPKYDAKGIETVRRDTCPAVAKLLEKMLRVLFTSRDIVAVKRFVKLQLSKILAERVSPQDFIFAREFRGLHGYQPSACVPALEITRRQLRRDPRAEPLVGERVPYVVVYGHPGQRLIELVRSPLELLSGQLRLNAHYYVARVIGPALNRVLRLLGADCLQWYEELPRPRFVAAPRPGTMAAYVTVNQLCLACGGQAESRQLCASCEADPGYAALVLGGKVQRVQKALLELQAVCHSCMGFQAGSVCLSIDCPVLFKTSRVTTEAQQALDWNSARNSVSTTSS
ncbi:uncharacterized protein PolZ1 isoform X1 [Dermacentor andersoni]|uniref:uncharacterized protein PolZ1 isoform X1 n=2 Tax=Dermacentor andersoni TaxID=34620 RepID=UPI002415E4B7|nr:uncharacterized protein LOC126522341 isoform X1 [Dermacentor andersoni]